MDTPETVAAAIEKAIVRSRREVRLGLPERLFALVNALTPGLIDRALRRQLPIVRRFASNRASAPAEREFPSPDIHTLGAQR
jgi:hypothetical protein